MGLNYDGHSVDVAVAAVKFKVVNVNGTAVEGLGLVSTAHTVKLNTGSHVTQAV